MIILSGLCLCLPVEIIILGGTGLFVGIHNLINIKNGPLQKIKDNKGQKSQEKENKETTKNNDQKEHS